MIQSWSDMTIGQFMKIHQLQTMGYEEDELVLRTAAVLAGIAYDDLLEMPVSKTKEYTQGLSFLLEKPRTNIAKKKYTLNGTEYNVCLNMEKLTTAQYIDFQNYAANIDDNLDKLIAVLFIPKGHKYNDGYEKEDVERDIRDYLCVEDGLGLSAFFFNLYKISIRFMLRYLGRMLVKLKKKAKTQEEMEAVMNLRKGITMMQEEMEQMHFFG